MHINNPFVVSPIICLGASKASHTKERKIRITCLISINKLNIMRFDIETSFTRLSINNSRPLAEQRRSLTHKRICFLKNFLYLSKVTKGVKWSNQLSRCKWFQETFKCGSKDDENEPTKIFNFFILQREKPFRYRTFFKHFN